MTMIPSPNKWLRAKFLALAGGALLAAAAEANTVDDKAVQAARDAFVGEMVKAHGFEPVALAKLMATAQIKPKILAAMSKPAERTLEWHEYRKIFLTEERINAGLKFWGEHELSLSRISEEYSVAPEMIVAIIGVETFFGRITGKHRVLDALSTLAFAYPPRAKFFRGELEQFLLLTREEGVEPSAALGSYAGAMGSPQFIPSSYRAYAVDASGDGKRDLWSDWTDVIGSVANYFSRHGWRNGEPVVAQATLGAQFQGGQPTRKPKLDSTVGHLSKQGYVFTAKLPAQAKALAMHLSGREGKEYWVGFHNFGVITRYNRSILYALAAHQLGQEILARRTRDSS
jgi:membrane-bound lytic murein transglycosylase B